MSFEELWSLIRNESLFCFHSVPCLISNRWKSFTKLFPVNTLSTVEPTVVLCRASTPVRIIVFTASLGMILKVQSAGSLLGTTSRVLKVVQQQSGGDLMRSCNLFNCLATANQATDNQKKKRKKKRNERKKGTGLMSRHNVVSRSEVPGQFIFAGTSCYSDMRMKSSQCNVSKVLRA